MSLLNLLEFVAEAVGLTSVVAMVIDEKERGAPLRAIKRAPGNIKGLFKPNLEEAKGRMKCAKDLSKKEIEDLRKELDVLEKHLDGIDNKEGK